MIEQDTLKLLRECDAGAKMGISSIDDVLGYVKDEELKAIDLNTLSPYEAMSFLFNLKKRLQ